MGIPLNVVLYEWMVKNMNIPADFGTIIAYLAFLIMVIYILTWIVKMIVSIIWPLFLISIAIITLQMMHNNGSTDLTELLSAALILANQGLTFILDNVLDYIQGNINT